MSWLTVDWDKDRLLESKSRKLKIVPIFQKAAFAFIESYHRHHKKPVGSVFQIAVGDGIKINGVAIFSRQKPKEIIVGCGENKYDDEGRVLRTDFENFSMMNVYMPSGSSGDHRQSFKMEWLEFFQDYIEKQKIKTPNLIVSGDYNICHQPIDIHNPKSNAKSSGFLPEERAWVTSFLESGFVDTFRFFNQQPHQYTWWSYRFNARSKNLGWRIDYHMATRLMEKRLKKASILSAAIHSDHCPVVLEID
jgi:exodeoxyribonuclease-3